MEALRQACAVVVVTCLVPLGAATSRCDAQVPSAAPAERARQRPAPQPVAATTDARPAVPARASATPPRPEPGASTFPAAVRALTAVRPIARPAGPLEVQVLATEPHGALTLQVIDRAGTLVDTIAVTPGTVDALPLTDAFAAAHRTLWLQLAEDGRGVGAPLWVTPLRSPPPVRTVRSVRASNQQPYLRVVGWGDRAFDPADPETAAAMPAWSAPDPVVTAGFRVEPATDAVLVTSEGPMRVALAPDAAPATVENFLRLARAGFYDGTVFHRVVPLDREGRPFVVQGGDPTGTGDGGPGWNLALEPSDLPHDRGVLGMARGDDPHSAGSQFYVGLSREGTARLDRQYCTFGFLLEGWETLDRIARCEIGDNATGRPVRAPRVERVDLVPSVACTPGRDPHGRVPPPAPPGAPAVNPAPDPTAQR